jgi:hypothetical protein
MNTNNVQLLNDNQIDDILRIIKRDILFPEIKIKIDEVLNSDKFKELIDTISNRQENLDKINEIESEYDTNLKLKVLFDQIREVDSNVLEYYDLPSVARDTVEQIGDYKKLSLEDLKRDIKRDAIYEIKLNDYYSIVDNISLDLRTRLQLTTVSDFQTIIDEMVKYIDINKYLYHTKD